MINIRHPQVFTLLNDFKSVGIQFEVLQIDSDDSPLADNGEDLLISMHGDPNNRQAFLFRNVDGGQLFWVRPSGHPSAKYIIRDQMSLRNELDSKNVVGKYILLFGEP